MIEFLFEFFIITLSVFLGFSLSIMWERRKEARRRKQILEMYTSLFRDELEANLNRLQKSEYYIYSNPQEKTGFAVEVIPLTTGVWELASGSIDLKYLNVGVLYKIKWAYTKINDFNNFLTNMLRPFILSKYQRVLKNVPYTDETISSIHEHFKKEAIEAIREATVLIKDFRL